MNISAHAHLSLKSDPSSINHADSTLLIVDDVLENRDLLDIRFSRRGFKTLQAEGGQAALSILENHLVDLVLLDVNMPGLSGIELLAKIRERWSEAELPVVMVTANALGADVAAALAGGANDYVTKPIDFVSALARVEAQLLRRAAHRRLAQELTAKTAKLAAANQHLQEEALHRGVTERQLTFLARHDALTGLPNRRTFEDQLAMEWREARTSGGELAVTFIDLDGFKQVNDVFGHAIGDQVLREIACRVSACIDDRDLLARLGGDEFCLLSTGQTLDHIEHKVMRALAAVADLRDVEGCSILIGASAGVAMSTDESDGSMLVRRADTAMYRAKLAGRGRIATYSRDMDAAIEKRRQLEIELREAITTGRLELHYQAIYHLRKKQLMGFEALCRWPRLDGSLTPPDEFIPIAEETGLIIPLGDWVIDAACHEAATWPAHLCVAVNLSPVQFRSAGLVERIASALSRHGIAPNRLELEITESVMLHDSAENIKVLNQLRDLGCRISMDDFGTGYSSLAYLQKFSFDKVKIDRSFLAEMTETGKTRAIIKAVTDLGLSFGVTTTAEGVETFEQINWLEADGCDQIQGFVFGPPRHRADVRELIDDIAGGLLP